MTKRIIVTILGIILVLAASMAWADHLDDGIARQQASLDKAVSSGQLDAHDAGRLQHNLDRIRADLDKYRDRGRYTPRVASKLEAKLQQNHRKLQQLRRR